MTDIPSFDRSKAEEEVDKFLLDQDMLNMYIEFQKRRAEDPDFKVPALEEEGEGLFSFQTFFILYLVYLAFSFFQRWAINQHAAGNFDGTNIPFIDNIIFKTPAVQGGVDAAQVVADSVQSSGAL